MRFARLGGVELDLTTIDGDELTLSGTGAAGLTLRADAPTVLADGETVRYYVAGTYARGTVRVDFAARSWADEDGNEGTASRARFTLVESVPAPADATPERVFYIDISGGMELRLAGAFDNQPILEIRGKVTLEIGRLRRSRRSVRLGHAEADRGRQHRLRRRDLRARDAATGSTTSRSGASPPSPPTSSSSSSTGSS